MSPTQDSSETFVFDPKMKSVHLYEINESEIPKPRRRHSSIIIGNSLLIYGGYDGNYLPDFDYLTLKACPKQIKSKIRVIETDTT